MNLYLSTFFVEPLEFFLPRAHNFFVGVAKHSVPQIVLLKGSHQNFMSKTLNSKGNQMQKKCFGKKNIRIQREIEFVTLGNGNGLSQIANEN